MSHSATPSEHRTTNFVCGAVLLLLCALPVLAAPPTGWFGMRLDFDTDGRANPTVKSVTVDDVFPDSPAARAHIAKQDQLISVEGHFVAGAKAHDVTELLHKAVGESVHMQLKHSGGELYDVVLTAVPLPDTGPTGPRQPNEGDHP